MAKQVQRRRGTEAENDAFTGAAAEVTVDTENDDVRVHDGSTAGGHRMVSARALQKGSFTWAGTFGGTANALTATLDPAVTAVAAGAVVAGIVASDNTGSVTADIGPGAVTLNKVGTAGLEALAEGDLRAGMILVLRHDGTLWQAVNPVAATVPGALQYLSTIEINNDATADFEDRFDEYEDHVFVFENLVPASDGVELYARLKIDGAYVTSNYYWGRGFLATNLAGWGGGANAATGAAEMRIQGGNTGSDTDESLNGRVELMNVNDTARRALLRARLTSERDQVVYGAEAVGGYHGTPTSHGVAGVRFYFSTGNLVTGKIHHFAIQAG